MAIAGVALAASLAAWAQGTAPDAIRSRSFELVDAREQVRGRLTMLAGGPSLVLLDTAGVERVSLRHDGEATALYLKDSAGDTRVGVAQFAHGGGGVALHGPRARGAAVLYHKDRGTLTFYGADGTVIQRLPDRDR